MGDIGEFYKDVNEAKKEKKQSNYESSLKLMEDSGIYFEEKANGHLIVYGKGDGEKATHDFWLTTGLFIRREGQKRGRGVRNLIRYIREDYK